MTLEVIDEILGERGLLTPSEIKTGDCQRRCRKLGFYLTVEGGGYERSIEKRFAEGMAKNPRKSRAQQANERITKAWYESLAKDKRNEPAHPKPAERRAFGKFGKDLRTVFYWGFVLLTAWIIVLFGGGIVIMIIHSMKGSL